MAGETNEDQPKKRRKKRRLSEADLGLFLRQYGRKAHRGHDPNDRGYCRRVEDKIKRMKPEDVDRLIRGEGTDRSEEDDGAEETKGEEK
jgi:hypothetical protein